ncbi:hypothetical protein L9F63_010219 [Diploptera punctata]|uniref:Phospholipase A2-like domain-containing protein n=1 Tax=Diploptera punctata TaxID=6984 RepID=A0AAD8EQD5_DIPPU|nr:hypothetical protein L9F63_010219 [Diploptera punctata]
MGDSKVVFDNDNLIINGTKYKATEGLMSLLTLEHPNQNLPEDEMINYEKSLINTNCIYQNNDPNTRKPKSSRSEKYKSIISPIWERMKKGVSKSNQYFSPSRRDSDLDVGSGEKKKKKKHISGKGLQKYTELPKELIWMNDVRKLVDRLIVIMGEEQSGNDNLYNEKASIMKMVNDTLANFILQDPKNIGHLIKIINMLPPKFWSKEAFGSGFVNDIINKLPFELHIPSYQYCGPGTKLEKILARGDQGINPLDAACKNHDIAYRDHKDLKDRHAADKVLEHRALERVFSKDSSIGEKIASLGVAGVMHALGAIGSIAGGAAGIVNAVHNKKKNDEELEEQKRHNLAMETKSDPPNVVVGSSISHTRKRKSTKKHLL